MTQSPLQPHLDLLLRDQLVVAVAPELYGFRHALMRDAAYASVLRRELRLTHLAVADTLEQMADSQYGDLAFHYYEAGHWDKALHYSQQAGDLAQGLYAPREAAAHFTRALAAAARMGQPPPPALSTARGQAHEALGDFDAARADYRTALESAQAAGDRAAEWEALLALGLLWAERDYARSGERLRQGLALARTLNDPRKLARSLNRMGNWHVNVDQFTQALACHHEALGIYQRLGDRLGLAHTHDLMGMAGFLRGDLLGGARHYQQAVALFRELDDRRALVSSLASLPLRAATYQTDLCVAAAPLLEAAQDGLAALDLARAIKQRSGEAYAQIFIAFALGPAGEYARAFEAARQGLALAEEIDHKQWRTAGHCVLGVLHWDVFSLADAQQHLAQGLSLARETGSSTWINCATGFLASICIERGELEQAAAVLALASARSVPAETAGQRITRHARGELALARGQAALALELADDLAATAPDYSGPGAIPRLARLRAGALGQLGRLPEAMLELQGACETAAEQGSQSELWRAHQALARCYQRLGRAAEAQTEAARANALIQQLAGQLADDDARQRFTRRAMAGHA